MESKTRKTPLIAIVGQTASGKSAMALELAGKYGGEIVCADSRTVYKDMDIGTAKPTKEDISVVKHHLLDIISPDQPFNASEFKQFADKSISNIQKRGKTPFLVGGSGLYVDGVVFDYDFSNQADGKKRDELNAMGLNELQEIIKSKNLPMPINDKNKRHLVRVIETNGKSPNNRHIKPNVLVIGIDISKSGLENKIAKRTDKMVEDGLIEETRGLSDKYGWSIEPMKSIGYREWRGYFEGQKTKEEAISQINNATKKFAKRQMTWFKRNKHIVWVKDLHEADKTVNDFLSKFGTIHS